MALFGSLSIALDLGSEYTTVYLPGEGIALREPTMLMVSSGDKREVIAAGRDAKQYLNRTDDSVEIISPVSGGAIADVELAAIYAAAMLEKATGRKRPLDKGTLVINVPTVLTRVERGALYQTVMATGARRVAPVKAPIAAAIGAGLDLSRAVGNMSVLVGGGVMEISVMSMNALVASRALRAGSSMFDEAIVNWYWRERGLVIGARTAEQLKIDIGTALKEDEATDDDSVLLKGRACDGGVPASMETNRQDIRRALDGPVQYIVDNMRRALDHLPPELAADILERGALLSGGGALLSGLPERLRLDTGMPFTLSESAESDTALGLGAVASDDRLFDALSAAGAIDELN